MKTKELRRWLSRLRFYLAVLFALPETDISGGGGRDIDVATCQENVLTDDDLQSQSLASNEGCFCR